ncbi:MAG: cytochrome c class I [Cytophagales bacterium]
MKAYKLITFLSVSSLMLFSCEKKVNETNKTEVVEVPQTEPTSEPVKVEESQMPLMAQSDCYSCHKDKDELVGPSFLKIAAKYPSSKENITLLADKVMKGGVGVWGQVPMSAHPTLSKEDAHKMIEYILSVK